LTKKSFLFAAVLHMDQGRSGNDIRHYFYVPVWKRWRRSLQGASFLFLDLCFQKLEKNKRVPIADTLA